MPIQIYNTILSWFLKKRYHQIELFKKYPIEVQNELLTNLVKMASNTEYGRKYDFSGIKNYREFKDRLPLNRYEDIYSSIERIRRGEQNISWPTPIKWFAKSSGTTNAKSKFIPVSNEALEDSHLKAGKDSLALFVNQNPDSQLFAGKTLRLGGSHSIYEHGETYFGDLSAIIIDNLPFWAEFGSTPSSKVSLMSGWEEKLTAIIDETIDEDVRGLAGVPSWMLVLLNEVLEKSNKSNLLEVWPNLELYMHGGVAFTPFKDIYEKLIPKQDFKYFEVYNASEGFFAMQDQNYNNELLLMLDYGIFYEFIPMDKYHKENPKVIPLEEVELNKNYAMVITTNAGLWRYVIGDTVKFTSLNPFRIKITGRTKHYINTFGEELIIENSDSAINFACSQTGASIKDYTAGPVFMKENKSGAHEWIIEFSKEPSSMDAFVNSLDACLKELNSDYEAKRFNNMTLSPPKVVKARPNLFYDWLKNKGKLGGQNKVPRLSNNREYLDSLLELNNN